MYACSTCKDIFKALRPRVKNAFLRQEVTNFYCILYFLRLSTELPQGSLEHPFVYPLVLFTPPREQKNM